MAVWVKNDACRLVFLVSCFGSVFQVGKHECVG